MRTYTYLAWNSAITIKGNMSKPQEQIQFNCQAHRQIFTNYKDINFMLFLISPSPFLPFIRVMLLSATWWLLNLACSRVRSIYSISFILQVWHWRMSFVQIVVLTPNPWAFLGAHNLELSLINLSLSFILPQVKL